MGNDGGVLVFKRLGVSFQGVCCVVASFRVDTFGILFVKIRFLLGAKSDV
jgi:hypothetical protein